MLISETKENLNSGASVVRGTVRIYGELTETCYNFLYIMDFIIYDFGY